MSETTQRKNARKFLEGKVISDKMQKTRVVQVTWATTHPKYRKVVRSASKYKAHDEKNTSKAGDLVRMMETRPISKEKRWVILEVIQSS